jgi:hypothetical protein
MSVKLAIKRTTFAARGSDSVLPFMLRDAVTRSLARASVICIVAFYPLSAMAEPPSDPQPGQTSAATSQVQVQPHESGFAPNSDEAEAVHKRLMEFDEMQKIQDASFDKALKICRGC